MDVRRRDLVASVAVLATSFVLGGATSWAQGVLPDSAAPFANSASGWRNLTALLLWVARMETPGSAILGAGSFLGQVLGYTAASALRDTTYDPTKFGLIAVVVGPVIGVAVASLRGSGWRLALATSALAGVVIGEAVYGLTVVADTTSPVYWTVVGVLGLALVVVETVRQRSEPVPAAAGVGLTAVVAAVFVGAYRAVGGI